MHEPAEIEWHNQGLAQAQGVAFTGMHKGPVQDWQPYNPHHPSLGKIGNHPAIMERDIAGECYGPLILPFCAPGYFRYRLNHLRKNTFPIRLKSHYVLGIWAHGKSSDFPRDTQLEQFHDRGNMPKWDADWTAIWESLNTPDWPTVVRIGQKGTEAVVLAEESLEAFVQIQNELAPEIAADLGRRFQHQKLAAEVFRAIDLFTGSWRAWQRDPNPDFGHWLAWARQDLIRLQTELAQTGLADADYAGAPAVARFLENTKNQIIGSSPEKPEVFLFDPIRIRNEATNQAEIKISMNQSAEITLDYGLELPDFGQSMEIGRVPAGTARKIRLMNLKPNERYGVQLRTQIAGTAYFRGDFWIFTAAKN